MASSLVGVKISPCILLLSIDIFSNRGSKNAKVLPVPVWAWAITSQPFFIMLILSSCIGVGVDIPFFNKTFVMLSLIPKSLKFISYYLSFWIF